MGVCVAQILTNSRLFRCRILAGSLGALFQIPALAQALIPLQTPVVEWAYGVNNHECDGLVSWVSSTNKYIFFSSACRLDAGSGAGTNSAIYRYDQATRSVRLVLPAGIGSGTQSGGAGELHYSTDDSGERIAIHSYATNLVPADTNSRADVFVINLAQNTTQRASVGQGGQQANGDSFYPTVSRDGRFVAFATRATNLSGVGIPQGGGEVVIVDTSTISVSNIASYDATTFGSYPFLIPRIYSLSSDANRIIFDAPRGFIETNATGRVLVAHDRLTGRSIAVCTDSGSVQLNGACQFASASQDGEVIAFSVTSAGRSRWFIKRFLSGTSIEISPSVPQGTWPPALNGAGTHALILALTVDVDRIWCNVVDLEISSLEARPVLIATSPESLGLGMYCPSRVSVSDDRVTMAIETGVQYVNTGLPYFGFTGGRLYIGGADWIFRSSAE